MASVKIKIKSKINDKLVNLNLACETDYLHVNITWIFFKKGLHQYLLLRSVII